MHRDLDNNDRTVKFIAKFIRFWKILNVHTPFADIRLSDLNRAVIRTLNDENCNNNNKKKIKKKLIDMSNFAKEIANKS